MVYPGDIVPIILDLSATAAVTSAPLITILRATDDVPQLLATPNVYSSAMSLISGSSRVYKFLWNTTGINNGTYIAVVSYIADGVTKTNVFLKDICLGDTRIVGTVALDATVAKDMTVAKDGTVMHRSDFVTPSNDLTVQRIYAKTSSLPSVVASQASIDAIASQLLDVYDCSFGNWTLNSSVGTLTLYRVNGAVLQVFHVSQNGPSQSRIRG